MAQGTPSNVKTMVEEHVAGLDAPIVQIYSDIDDHIDGHPELKHDAELMRSISGVGNRAPAPFLAYVGNARRVKSAKALAAFVVGVTPKHKQSGTSINGRTMSPSAGHTVARKSLYMPGLAAKRHKPVVVAMGKCLEQKGLAPQAIAGASMRKLLHLIYGVIKSAPPLQAKIPTAGLEIHESI